MKEGKSQGGGPAGKASSSAPGTAEEVQTRLEDAIEQGQAQAQEAARSAKERTREFADRAQERGREWLDTGRVRGREMWEDTMDFVRDHPLAAVGIALAAGAVLGSVMTAGASEEPPEHGERKGPMMARTASERVSSAVSGSKHKAASALTALRDLLDEAVAKLG